MRWLDLRPSPSCVSRVWPTCSVLGDEAGVHSLAVGVSVSACECFGGIGNNLRAGLRQTLLVLICKVAACDQETTRARASYRGVLGRFVSVFQLGRVIDIKIHTRASRGTGTRSSPRLLAHPSGWMACGAAATRAVRRKVTKILVCMVAVVFDEESLTRMEDGLL